MDEPLKGKVALITGAGSGLGEATARAFGRAGCAVPCVDVDGAAAGRVSRDLVADDVPAIALEVDAGDPAAGMPKSMRCGFAKATSCTGNQHNFSAKISFHMYAP